MSITRTYNIYFICKGTSTNDIIKSVNKTFKEKKQSLINSFWGKKNNSNISNKQTKIELDDFSPLEDIGVKEMYMCKDSNNIVKKITSINTMIIYSALDLSAIESGLILSQGKSFPVQITPLPYMSSDKKINSRNLQSFINLFGILLDTYTDSKSYWKTKNSQFLNISSINTLINWDKILNNDKNLSSYNIDKFKSIFKDSFLENYKKISNIPIPGMPSVTPKIPFKIPIIIADYELISKLLRNISSKDSKLYEIEKGSIWKIEIDIIFTHNGVDITNKDIKYKNFVKEYPTEYNHLPLTFVNTKTFKFDHNAMSYILFNAKNDIPLNFLKGMIFFRLSPEKQLAIKKAIEISEKTITNKTKDKESVNNTNSTIINVPVFKFD